MFPFSSQNGKNVYPILDKQAIETKINTRFQIKTVQNPYDLGRRIPICCFSVITLFLAGVYKEAFSSVVLSSDYFDQLSKDDKKAWQDKHNEGVMDYFNRSLVTKIGRPALKMLRFVPGAGGGVTHS